MNGVFGLCNLEWYIYALLFSAFYLFSWTGSSRNHSTHPKPLTLAVICIVIIILTCTVVFAYMWRKKIGHKLGNNLWFSILN